MFSSKRLKNVKEAFKSLKGQNPETSMESSKSPPRSKNLEASSKSRDARSPASLKLPISSSNKNKIFLLKEVNKHGMSSKPIAAAFDFTQNLLAIGTVTGELHIYGQQQVEVVVKLEDKSPIKEMRFVKGIYLVVINAKDTIFVISLYSQKVLTTVFIPGKITSIDTDASLDWMLIGLQSGSTIIYDIDRDQLSTFRLDNLQKSSFFPAARLSPIVSIQWNPRDIGTVLISYEYVTLTYSLVENTIKQSFIYELPPFAPGGDFSKKTNEKRTPKVIQSLYHPNSLHILTVHEDNSLVFWDANSGHLIMARTLFETDINIPQPDYVRDSSASGAAISKVYWMCENNPEYTSLLISHKPISKGDNQSLTMIDLGYTPRYSITSYDGMKNYYANPKQMKIFPLPTNEPVINVLPIPRQSPYFAGCHNPGLVALLLDNGEIETMLYPSGIFTNKASLFPQNLSWLRPIATVSMAASVPNKLWLGALSAAQNKDYLLKGGVRTKRQNPPAEYGTAIITGHSNGSVRICDASHGDIQDNASFEVNLSRTLNKANELAVDKISFATETLELAVSIETGDVVLFKYEVNQFYNAEKRPENGELEMSFRRFSLNNTKDVLVDVRDRAPTSIRQGFMPLTAVHANKGKTSAINNSNIGFVGIGYSAGNVMLIDRRGPAIIYMENIREIQGVQSARVTCIEFVIMEYGDDGYSSILMLCGTDMCELITYKILPAPGGRFNVEFMDITNVISKGPVRKIDAFSRETKSSCLATIPKMQNLSKGLCIPGLIMITGFDDIRLTSLGKAKSTHKSFKFPLATTGLSYIPFMEGNSNRKISTVLITLEINGHVKIFSLPDFKEQMSEHIPFPIAAKYIAESSVLRNGDMLVRVSEFQVSLFSTVKEQNAQAPVSDVLYINGIKIPYRPQVNSLQWARGTVYCTPTQLNEVLGGTNRPDSKYKESIIAQGTFSERPSDDNHENNLEHQYTKPTRKGRNSSYGVMRNVSRAVETRWDAVEDRFNDYATAMGETMNEAVEQTGKDVMKGALGF
ncbi:Sro7p [Saccharomyces cerevisiae x Saccharomyces kudriavzevii VIN7]|uniref:Sro7p n=1 Tax=Saccharomyces cerevisiae x Saccharomyces kudriavzevii (strain VIN7) TaxID=1095631 RepID=H0H2B8_SACCK|nr:Sro7p [Saccharomyces cerevisiae x Saccharomyces kudriavzevii VIN7]